MIRAIYAASALFIAYVTAEIATDIVEVMRGDQVLVEEPVPVPPLQIAGCNAELLCSKDDVVSKPLPLPRFDTLDGWQPTVHPEPAPPIGQWETKTIRAKPTRKTKSTTPTNPVDPWYWLTDFVDKLMRGENVTVLTAQPWSNP